MRMLLIGALLIGGLRGQQIMVLGDTSRLKHEGDTRYRGFDVYGASKADYKKWHDGELWEGDLIACLEKEDCSEPIRGWKLKFKTVLQIDAAIDVREYAITATKTAPLPAGGEPVARTEYFHAYFEAGVDNKNGQTVLEIRLKHLNSASEDWKRDPFDDLGEWNAAHTKHWVPGSGLGSQMDGKTTGLGMCHENEFASGPMTKDACFK